MGKKHLHKNCKFYKIEDHTCINPNNGFSYIRREYACKRFQLKEEDTMRRGVNSYKEHKRDKKFKKEDKLRHPTIEGLYDTVNSPLDIGTAHRSRKLLSKLLDINELEDWKNTKQINNLLGEPFSSIVLDELVFKGFILKREYHEGRFIYQYKTNPKKKYTQNKENYEELKGMVKHKMGYHKLRGLVIGKTDKCLEDLPKLLGLSELKDWCTMRRIGDIMGYEYNYPIMRRLVSQGILEEQNLGRLQFRLKHRKEEKKEEEKGFVDKLIGNGGNVDANTVISNGNPKEGDKVLVVPTRQYGNKTIDVEQNEENGNETALGVIDRKIGEYKMEIAKLTNKIGILQDIRDEI
jgi:hypothetical protein